MIRKFISWYLSRMTTTDLKAFLKEVLEETSLHTSNDPTRKVKNDL
jgi:hypothetical protein